MTHLRHSLDGYPLCWNLDQEGDFKGSYDEADVDCPECLTWMAEEKI